MAFRSFAQATLLVMLLGGAAGAAETAPGLTIVSESAFAPAGVRQFIVHSQRVGGDFVVVVSTPAGPFVQPGRKLPTVYALDGGYGVTGAIGQMMAWAGAMSPAYVVTVAYPKGEDGRRNTDLLYRPANVEGAVAGGGGAAFEAFLTTELRPFLAARYPMDTSQDVLFGHSFGGLFAANVLADTPNDFAGYVIASPSVWADPQLPPRLRRAAGGAGRRRVFVAVGGKEEPRMLQGMDEVASALAAPGSLMAVRREVFTEAAHIGYYSDLVPMALRWVLPPPAAAPATRTAVAVSPEDLDRLTGVYAIADGRVVTVTRRDARLFAEVTGAPGGEVMAETPRRFFVQVSGFDVTLSFDGAGAAHADELVFSINGVETKAHRAR